ncbi:MAG TPA: hypothetical protein VFF81_14850 [Noviherbaspirillum sp.]|nr:hypothetical protein [Noviherbaspirillum sp.]
MAHGFAFIMRSQNGIWNVFYQSEHIPNLDLATMTSPVQEFAITLLQRIAHQLPSDFSGLGVVFYDHLEALPFIALEVLSRDQIRLPVNGMGAIASTLASVSSSSSGWHDGFHFVDISKQQLTHLAQFLSPPLPKPNVPTPKASGARHMTAMLATRINGIAGIGILTNNNELAFFDHGMQTLRVTVQ